MTDKLGNSVQLVGDDVFVTNEHIQKGIEKSQCYSDKGESIGTLTERLKR